MCPERICAREGQAMPGLENSENYREAERLLAERNRLLAKRRNPDPQPGPAAEPDGQSKRVRVSVYLTPETRKRLRVAAAERDRDLGAIVESALRAYLGTPSA